MSEETPGAPPLEAIAERLRDAEFDAQVHLGQGTLPDRLMVALEPDSEGRILHLQVMYLEANDPAVLQYYVGLPKPVEPEATLEVCRFLNTVNAPLPIGAFGLLEPERTLYFRHNVPVSTDPFDLDLLGWTITMVDYLIGHLSSLLEQVGSGLDYLTARARLLGLLEETAAD
ncbi:MAG: hypothetical protein JWM85_1358 [Acidimicrobiaceae bacterium]|nr:hypothetical protein [Acidimicrobiaceae bacterium]